MGWTVDEVLRLAGRPLIEAQNVADGGWGVKACRGQSGEEFFAEKVAVMVRESKELCLAKRGGWLGSLRG